MDGWYSEARTSQSTLVVDQSSGQTGHSKEWDIMYSGCLNISMYVCVYVIITDYSINTSSVEEIAISWIYDIDIDQTRHSAWQNQ